MPPRAEPDVVVPEGDAKKGAKVFKSKCAQCHTCNKGGDNKSGPNLHGIFGRETGYAEFTYSGANKNANIIWSEKHMFEFLLNPKKYLVGTTMVFSGMKKEKERADCIAFMKESCGNFGE